ncbi:MAG: response regulator transcription factor [Terriglobia bacterium]
MHETLKALVATGDMTLADKVTPVLQRLHFEVITSRDDNNLNKSIRLENPDMLVLDFELPQVGGVELCRKLRQHPTTAQLPLIMMTARDDEREVILSLEAGADACVNKPPAADALSAHVKAVARRTLPEVTDSHLRAGPIVMDLARWIVYVDNEPVELTKTEFKLLQILLEAKGRALTREYLLRKVWSHPDVSALHTKTVDVHIGRLRRKLGPTGNSIITVRNVGFRFEIMVDWIVGQFLP